MTRIVVVFAAAARLLTEDTSARVLADQGWVGPASLRAAGAASALPKLARAKTHLSSVERTAPLFPTPDTPPAEVVEAQLEAFRERDLAEVFRLYSRARRMLLKEGLSHKDKTPGMREGIPSARLLSALEAELERDCPGLLGHGDSQVLAAFSDPMPTRGLIPTVLTRVRVDGVVYVFTLTRQSASDGMVRADGERRFAGQGSEDDGFELCWFVWKIRRESGGSEAATPVDPKVLVNA